MTDPPVGIVGDTCEICRTEREFDVIDLYSPGRPMILRESAPVFERSIIRCRSCGHEKDFIKTEYDEVISADSPAPPLDQLLERTHRKLWDAIRRRREAEAGGGERYRVAMDRLRAMGDSPEVREMTTRVQQWPRITDGERDELWAQVGQMEELHGRIQQTVAFIRNSSPSFPMNAGCTAFILLLLPGLGLFALIPFLRSWLWGPVYVVALGAVVAIAAAIIEVHRVKSWTRRSLIPTGERQGIDFNLVVGLLGDLGREPAPAGDRTKEMARCVHAVAAALFEKGLITLPAGEAHPPAAS